VKEDALKEAAGSPALRAPRLLAQTYAMNNLSPRAQQVLALARKEAIRQHGFHPNPNNVRKRTIPGLTLFELKRRQKILANGGPSAIL
jgi:hypothetical protein